MTFQLNKLFIKGFKAMLPITTGVIPFGMVMGSVSAEAKLTLFQSTAMNLMLYAGAAQLAAVDLMKKNTAFAVVVVTAVVINLRFLLYSAAISPMLQRTSFFKKLICAHGLTDQTYAVMSAHQSQLKSPAETITFFLGASACMFLAWQASVLVGFLFGNFAPESLALDYAVPLSFVALVVPTLKNKKYVLVAVFSSIVSVLLTSVPYRLGLIITALLSIVFAVFLTRKKKVSS